MKEYVKPTIEIVELRPEERLAKCNQHYKRPSGFIDWLFSILGICSPCKSSWNGTHHCS
jgi:hypothetical protein